MQSQEIRSWGYFMEKLQMADYNRNNILTGLKNKNTGSQWHPVLNY